MHDMDSTRAELESSLEALEGTGFEFEGEMSGETFGEYGGQGTAGEFEAGNLTLQVMDAASVGREFRPSGHPIAFHVEDVEAARAELEAKGVGFQGETLDSGVCHMAFFTDPDGNVFMFHNRYAPRSS